jgi:dinuclear metal center YbgI/SA1388 family protein
MSGDSIGLQIGDPEQDVRQVIVTVDVTPAVVAEAVRKGADMLISHHPLIYTPLPSVRLDVYPQSLVYTLVCAKISHFAMHTNFDAADGGINDVLADRLGLVDTKVLEPTHVEKSFKLVTFVPSEAVDAVREALADAGAGIIGRYTHCSFQAPGTGTFEPMEGAEPYIGNVGKQEKAPEYRLEMLVTEKTLHDAVSALLTAHPYEEVAYDVYPLKDPAKVAGIGRYGVLRAPMSFDGFCEMVKDVLSVEDARVCGDPESRVSKVAVLGGSGGGSIGLAKSLGVDAFVTGDVRHHQFVEARAIGLNVIDATHFHTERPGMIALAPLLHDLLSSEGITVDYLDDEVLAGD